VVLWVGVACGQPWPRTDDTPAPPCHRAKALSVPLVGPLSLVSREGSPMTGGVAHRIELSTMHAGVEQPAHAPVPTDFVLSIFALNAK